MPCSMDVYIYSRLSHEPNICDRIQGSNRLVQILYLVFDCQVAEVERPFTRISSPSLELYWQNMNTLQFVVYRIGFNQTAGGEERLTSVPCAFFRNVIWQLMHSVLLLS
jgi:hypothetical protein